MSPPEGDAPRAGAETVLPSSPCPVCPLYFAWSISDVCWNCGGSRP